MNEQSAMSRRRFLQAAALTAAAVPLGTAPAAEPPASKPASIKVGCLSWNFHNLARGADPEPAIDLIGEMGFDGIELIVNVPADLTEFWTDERVDRLKKKLEARKLQVSQFVMFQPVVEGLSSLDAAVRARNLDNFEAGCRLGKRFGAPLVNIVAPWARELKGPGGYLPRYYDLSNPKPEQKFHIDIAAGFDWEAVWQRYIETTRACLERAKAHGLRFSIEHHTHCLIPDATAFLRLWDSIRDPALGFNLDTGWTLLQREYPPLAIHKVKRHLVNLHVRDIDGAMRRFVPIGRGVMDFQAIIDTLKTIGFNGFISLEQDGSNENMREICQRYLELMRKCIG